MQISIDALGGGGRGVARVDGRVCFVSGALPGEIVEAEVERRRASVVEARTVAVLSGSDRRDPDPCPVAGRCGGCDLAHVRRDAVDGVLREVIGGALRHANPVLAAAVSSAEVVVSPMQWRLRARLHWDPVAQRLGFLGPRSHEVVDISPCRVVSPRLLASLPELEAALRATAKGGGDLIWLEDLASASAVAGWLGPGPAPREGVAGLAGCWRLDRYGLPLAGGWGLDHVVMALPVALRVPVGAFFQGNRFLVPKLFERVRTLVSGQRPERVVDLYGGVGFLAAAARAGGASELVVVEPSRVSARAAADNLADAAVVNEEAESYLRAPASAGGSLAIVDPPRSGLSAAARAALLEWRPASVLMLGCDAARFGRDAGALLAGGYHLELLEIWDLFAGSHHAEILASFRRDPS
jgi:23S rRNA (uracil1939-C5)-methyltransferase